MKLASFMVTVVLCVLLLNVHAALEANDLWTPSCIDPGDSALSLLQRAARLHRVAALHDTNLTRARNEGLRIQRAAAAYVGTRGDAQAEIHKPAIQIEGRAKSYSSESRRASTLVTQHTDSMWVDPAWSLLVVFATIIINILFRDSTGICQAICSTVLCGVNGYILGLSAFFAGVEHSTVRGIAYVSWMWIFGFVSIIGFHVAFSFSDDEYIKEWKQVKVFPFKVWIGFSIAGIFAFMAVATLQICFGTSLSGSGPHFALGTAYGIVVTPFFWLCSNEKMSLGQILGLASVCGGAIAMSSKSLVPVLVSLAAVLMIAVDIIAIRFAGMWCRLPRVGVVLRLGVMCMCGLISAIVCHVFLREPLLTPNLYLLALYGAICDSLSIWFIMKAFDEPNCKAGVISGILPAQTLVMSLMNLVIMGWQPAAMEWLGQGLVLCGSSAIGILTISQELDETGGSAGCTCKKRSSLPLLASALEESCAGG